MAEQKDLDFTYTTIDKIFRLSMGETGDYSGAKYDGDFSMTLEAAKKEGADMMTIHTYSAFLSSLDAAYDAALTQVAKQQQRVVKSRESWVGAHRRATSFDALADRYDQEQSRAEARREARLQDEFNTNVAARASLLRN